MILNYIIHLKKIAKHSAGKPRIPTELLDDFKHLAIDMTTATVESMRVYLKDNKKK